jgi:uncharacterized protein
MKRYVICLVSIFIFLFACGFDSQCQKVYDNADLLTQEEETSLQQLCVDASEKSKADIIIVTVDSLEGQTAQAYADDFFDYNGFGYEEEMGTGTLFLISIEDRECAFSTSGDCEDIFSQNASDKIREDVTAYLSDGEYYNGLVTYVENTQEYIENGGKSDTQKVRDYIIEIVAALVIGAISIWIMYSGSTSKMTVDGYTYATGHKSELLQHHDVFERTTTISRHIEKNNGGSGGSGSHIGSSGNSHGGSSGSF